MKQLIFFVAFIFSIPATFAQKTVVAGGFVSPIHSVICENLPAIDFSKPGHLVALARCTINNNLPEFEVNFRFNSKEQGEEESVHFTDYTLVEIGGKRGEGIVDPTGMSLPVTVEGQRVTWKPGPQKDATVNYVVELKASWVTPKLTHHFYLPHLTQSQIAAN